MVVGAVGNNDLVLWWCPRLFHAQLTFVFEKTLEVEVKSSSFLKRWKEFLSLARKASLISSYVGFDVVG